MARPLSELRPAVIEGAVIGSEKDQLDTPALLLDLDRSAGAAG